MNKSFQKKNSSHQVDNTRAQTLVFFGPPGGAVPRTRLAEDMAAIPEPPEPGGDVRDAPPTEVVDVDCGVESLTSGDARICW